MLSLPLVLVWEPPSITGPGPPLTVLTHRTGRRTLLQSDPATKFHWGPLIAPPTSAPLPAPLPHGPGTPLLRLRALAFLRCFPAGNGPAWTAAAGCLTGALEAPPSCDGPGPSARDLRPPAPAVSRITHPHVVWGASLVLGA
ncbi:hypothetical protein NDU88_003486 [Pleurodeles waltl]|uniref:Uncharacterized protein n=1 Tax=Pleurodeles waltl TaxID=8319 RepID=A0AAV7W688_PLEWA|nr:hypothetical protein NDU88_003486 [Pleurodeles waltl]